MAQTTGRTPFRVRLALALVAGTAVEIEEIEKLVAQAGLGKHTLAHSGKECK